MIRAFLLVLVLIYSLETKGQEKKEGSKTKSSKSKVKPGKAMRQMFHFEKRKVDNRKSSNGTSYRLRRQYRIIENEKDGFKIMKRNKFKHK